MSELKLDLYKIVGESANNWHEIKNNITSSDDTSLNSKINGILDTLRNAIQNSNKAQQGYSACARTYLQIILSLRENGYSEILKSEHDLSYTDLQSQYTELLLPPNARDPMGINESITEKIDHIEALIQAQTSVGMGMAH